MNAIIILGSRNPSGQTARAAGALAQGMESEGAEVKSLFLPTMQVERCRQCDDVGWGICRSEGRCVIADDFASTLDMIRGAEAVVFANPVYFGDLSESLRAFLDRLRRTCMNPAGKQAVAGKMAVGICVAGGGGGGAPHCVLSLEKVLVTCGFNIVDLIPVRRQNLEAKLEILRSCGRHLALGAY